MQTFCDGAGAAQGCNCSIAVTLQLIGKEESAEKYLQKVRNLKLRNYDDIIDIVIQELKPMKDKQHNLAKVKRKIRKSIIG